METTTLYNLDDCFFSLTPNGVSLWVINNILTSAVGHKVIYELQNPKTNAISTLDESKLKSMVENKEIVPNIEDARQVLI